MDITVKNLQSKFPIPVSKIQLAVQKVVKTLRSETKLLPGSIAIVFVGKQRMQSINKKYLGHDYVTDVITFNLGDTAEIIICPFIALRNAASYQVPFQKELMLYVIHGLLHLAGYDDHKPKDIEKIRIKESEFLSKVYG